MSSLIYFVLFGFAAVTLVVMVAGLWRHNIPMSMFGAGALLLLAGLVLNLAGLRHTVAGGKAYSWGVLPDWAYTGPIVVGTIFVVLAWLPKLRLLLREWRSIAAARRKAKAAERAAAVANKRHAAEAPKVGASG